ncbi:MAG: SDR family NAD(P)-dependent oxidoreductase [Micavibrio sp.]
MKSFRNILITGASSGIGEALALHLAAPAITLFLTGRDQDRLALVVEKCKAQGATCYHTVVNVKDQTSFANWISQMDSLAPIDLVIANAGVSSGTGGAQGLSWLAAEYDVFETNVMGVLHTIFPLIEKMAARKRGQIALMSSLAAFNGWPGAPAYSASKAAVRYYGEALRGALGTYGVGVSVICPGFVESRMTAVNNYRMPFFMKAPQAAAIILQGLAQNRARIAFPLPTYIFSGLIGFLPAAAASALLSKMPPKPMKNISE